MQFHYNIFHYLKNKELNELYATVSIRTFALTMTGLFIPIFLYQLGHDFSTIFYFYAISALFNIFFLVPAAKFSSKFGLKHSILASIPPLILFFLLLFSLEIYAWPLWFLAFVLSIHLALFWFSYHTDFSKFSSKKKRGSEIGFSRGLISIAGALGPIIGGIILSFLGFKFLFGTVSILLFISSLPLFLSREVHEPIEFSLKGFFKESKLGDILTYIGHGVESRLGLVAWPLFIFVFILGENYISLGSISSLAFFSSLLITLYASKFTDVNRKFLLKIGSIFTSVFWVIKSFLTTVLGVYIIDILYGASKTCVHIPFDAMNYDKTKKKNKAKIILQREIYIKVGAFFILIILAMFSEYITQIFRYAGPLSSLFYLFF